MVGNQKKFSLSKEELTEIARICRRFGISCLILFGSKAKQEICIKDDIDIAVLAEDTNLETDQEIKLFNALLNLFQTDKLDLVVLNRASPLLLKEVAISGKPLYEKKRGVFDSFQIKAIKKYLDAQKFFDLQHQCVENFLTERGL